jgi:bifunctional UDP-N-acetylglucosamine pyrophosphorylase/glucosamine-1-phosphate N-acetyltransferase
MSELHVVVLAAGQGTRMRSALPKVLHCLAGKPMLAHVVDTALSLSPAQVHVVYGHGGEVVRERLRHLPVSWVEQSRQLGTGHAVQQVVPHLADDVLVLVLYGDVPLTSSQTLQAVVEEAGRSALALVTIDLDDPTGYGRIIRDAAGQVTGIVEHKDATAAQRAIGEGNSGIMAASARVLKPWLARLSNDNAQGEYYLTDVIAMAAATEGGVRAVKAGGLDEVLGVNDRLQLAHLERVYQRGQAEALMREGASIADPARVDVRGSVQVGQDVFIDVNVVFEGEVRLESGVSIGPNCVIRDAHIGAGTRVFASCVVEEARVGRNARIGPFARLRPGSELADEVHIGNYVEVKNTCVGERSKVNHLTYLGDSTIGVDTNIGAGTITCNYDGAHKHRTVVGDRVFIGSGVELVAPITIHDGATVGAGSTLSKDAPPEQLTVARARQVTLKGWCRPTKPPRD